MSEVFEYVQGYENGIYTDNMIFEIDPETKMAREIVKQPLIAGENNSQFIRFEMPRYYDGVDLSGKNIQFIYLSEDGYSDICAAINVERNDEKIRFGWLVPLMAVYSPGTLCFGAEFVGNNYVLKSGNIEVEVLDGLNGAEIIPEPLEQAWYIELQSRCADTLEEAEDAKSEARECVSEAEGHKDAAAGYATDAQTAKTQAESHATDAEAAAQSAEHFADLAADVFTVAGNVSFAIASDGGVAMIFSDSDE